MVHGLLAGILGVAVSACTPGSSEAPEASLDTSQSEVDQQMNGPERCLALTEFGLRERFTNQYSGDFEPTVGVDSLEFQTVNVVANNSEIQQVNHNQGVDAAMTAARPLLINVCQNAELPPQPLEPWSLCGQKVLEAVDQALWDSGDMESFNWHVNAWGPNSPEGKALREVVDGELLSIAARQGYAVALARASHEVDTACEFAGSTSGLATTGVTAQGSYSWPARQADSLPEPYGVVDGVELVTCHQTIYYYAPLLHGSPDLVEELIRRQYGGNGVWQTADSLRQAAADPELGADPKAVAGRVCSWETYVTE